MEQLHPEPTPGKDLLPWVLRVLLADSLSSQPLQAMPQLHEAALFQVTPFQRCPYSMTNQSRWYKGHPFSPNEDKSDGLFQCQSSPWHELRLYILHCSLTSPSVQSYFLLPPFQVLITRPCPNKQNCVSESAFQKTQIIISVSNLYHTLKTSSFLYATYHTVHSYSMDFLQNSQKGGKFTKR